MRHGHGTPAGVTWPCLVRVTGNRKEQIMRAVWGFVAGVILTIAGVIGLGVADASAPMLDRQVEVPVYPYDGCTVDCGLVD